MTSSRSHRDYQKAYSSPVDAMNESRRKRRDDNSPPKSMRKSYDQVDDYSQ